MVYCRAFLFSRDPPCPRPDFPSRPNFAFNLAALINVHSSIDGAGKRADTADGQAAIRLIIATRVRVATLDRFLAALASQTYDDYEVILVDQNDDDRLVAVVARYDKEMRLIHLRTSPGLSHSRNVALAIEGGSVVGFPDDDCWYAPNVLEQVDALFRTQPHIDGLAGRCATPMGVSPGPRWSRRSGQITRRNVWYRGVSSTVFLRRWVIDAVGAFDESLGLGASTEWQSGEETDYLLRALKVSANFHYDPTLVVYHEASALEGAAAVVRTLRAGRGTGRVLRKHGYQPAHALAVCTRPLAGAALDIAVGRMEEARIHWALSRGRISGWTRSDTSRIE